MYKFKTTPFQHQKNEFERTKDFHIWGFFFEQGTGKSKLTIDTAGYLCDKNKIDAVIVIAPNGVHHNWAINELPKHCARPYTAFAWRTNSAKTKRHQKLAEHLLNEYFPWLLMSYDAFMTKAGRAYAELFAWDRHALCVLDESQRIKTITAKRSRALHQFGRLFTYKRLLSGTPITNTPFDIYSQFKFLDWNLWAREGFAAYAPFKTHFGVWIQRSIDGRRFKQCVNFKNLDQLSAIVKKYSSRVLKEDVLDLPPKLYTQHFVELSSEQRRLYAELRDNLMTELQSGEMITAPLIITKLLRLQQILCGYLPSDDCEALNPLPENPRLAALKDLVDDIEGKAIIYARFRPDIDAIVHLLGDDCVRYDGAVKDNERISACNRFQDPDGPRWFVGNPAACGVGINLTAASTVIYYSNSFVLEHRLQSEDRPHRIGQTKPVLYIDIVTSGTVDPYIVKALRGKFNIASQVNADKVREWI